MNLIKKSTFYNKYSILLVLAIIAFFCTILGLLELALGIIAIIPVYLLAWISFRDGTIEPRLLSLSYLAGQLLCWVFGFLGCLYFLEPIGYQIGKYPFISLILINLVTWSGSIGSWLALPFYKNFKSPTLFNPLPNKKVEIFLVITGIIFFVFLIGQYASGIFYIRSKIGNSLPVGSSLYFLVGLGIIQYLFFFFLGTRLNARLFSVKNLIYFAILIICMMVMGITGGREASVKMAVLFLLGSLYARLSLNKIRNLFVGLTSFILIFVFILGLARGIGSNFVNSDLSGRLTLIGKALTGQTEKQGHYFDHPLYGILVRIALPQGQLVIDEVAATSKSIGFRNFERLSTFFFPKIIIGEKLPPDDGNERLKDEYGLVVNKFTSAPITFMADAFERGGYIAVFFASLILSFWLTLVGGFIYNFKDPLIKSPLIGALSVTSLQLYPSSVLGSISLVTYGFTRDILLIVTTLLTIKFLVKKLTYKNKISQ